ncbi:MAG: hypothetical protein GY756_03870 [bacterium]|nr:hypothetical protein [bacterium]
MKVLKILTFGWGVFTIATCFFLSQNVCTAADNEKAKADGFKTFETQGYYEEHVAEFTTEDWLDFASHLNDHLPKNKLNELRGLRYYLRINSSINLTEIQTHDCHKNPDNVNRVIRLMPENLFEEMFPNSKTGPCSYINFLKSVALLPGLFSNYKDFQQETGLQPTAEMTKPDLLAKKILAAIMANAVQETSNTGEGTIPTMEQKVPGAFAVIAEPEKQSYNDSGMGVFAPGQPWDFVAKGNIYSGRGVHQITYGMNYANISLILYGDLRLVKYPNLIVSDTVLPWLTTLIYFVMPQSQYPTIAEVFDGQWERHLNSPSITASWKDRYMKEFPMCVLLINGGIECGQKSMGTTALIKSANNNTKIRGGAYRHFVEDIPIDGKELFDKHAPKYEGALTGEEVVKACHAISQNDKEESSKGLYQGLNWHRYFFILDYSFKLASWNTGNMVFCGSNIEKLMPKKP